MSKSATSTSSPDCADAAANPLSLPSGDRRVWLDRLIDTEIIPRLMLAHAHDTDRTPRRVDPPAPQFAPPRLGTPPPDNAAADLATRLIAPFAQAGSSFVRDLVDQDVDREALFLEVLAPAARILGEMWDEDQVDFAHVTVGLSRLHRILHDLSEPEVFGRDGFRVLLAPGPGEQHTFGLAIVSEFFRRAGWETWVENTVEPEDLHTIAHQNVFDVVGFSLSRSDRVKELALTIKTLREVSRNPDVLVFVGGKAFDECADLAEAVGADATAADARLAVTTAERLLRDTMRAKTPS
ncbi:MAG: B12-binding domain-containing protein [Maricaulaceae bacterium]